MMQLKYRGVSYQVQTQTIQAIDTETSVKYRGVTYQIRRPVLL
jgi:hypothetical protein